MMVQGEVYPGVVYPPPNQGHLGYQQRGYSSQPPPPQGPQYSSNGYYDNAFAVKVVQKPFPASPYRNDNHQQHVMDEEDDEEEDDDKAWGALDNHQTGWKNEYDEPGYCGNNNNGFQPSPVNNYSNGRYYEEAIPVAVPIRPPRRVQPPVGRGGYGGSHQQQYPAFEYTASPVYQKPPQPEYWGTQDARPVYQKPQEYWVTNDVKPSYPKPEYWATKDVRPSYPKPEYWATKDVKPGFQKPEYWATKDVKPGFQKPEYWATKDVKPGYPKQEYWGVKGV